jgi:RimJ/RimL family protein N-acetyltransferase
MIIGDNICLRDIKLDDLPILNHWDNDPFLQYFTGKKISYTVHNENKIHKMIQLKDGTLIGDIELNNIIWNRHEGELSIRIAVEPYCNNGLGREAIKVFLNYIFSSTNISSIYLKVYEDNIRAIKCYKKFGFKKECYTKIKRNNIQDSFRKVYLMTYSK